MAQKAHKPHGKAGNPNPVHPPKGQRWGGRAADKGKINERDRVIAEASGVMPKFALLDVMRHYINEYETTMRERPRRPGPKTRAANPNAMAEFREELIQWRKDWTEILELIRVAAKDAAPYFHARLSALKVHGQGLEDIQKMPIEDFSDEQLTILAHRIGIAAGLASGLVADIEPDPV